MPGIKKILPLEMHSIKIRLEKRRHHYPTPKLDTFSDHEGLSRMLCNEYLSWDTQ